MPTPAHPRAALAAAALLAAAACTTTPAAHTTATPGAASAAPQMPDHSGQSLWHVIDQDGKTLRRLPDDDPVVTAVRKTVVLHSGAVDNRDQQNLADSIQQEFTYYHPDFVAALRSQQYEDKLTRLFTTNHLATRQLGVAWYQSTFPQDMTTAKVAMDATIEFTAADPAYLAANHFELHTRYTQHRTVSLTKNGDRWTITAIDKNPLEQAVAPPEPTG
ncbi:hypothetical protein [Kitasatospora terrestris]|uniref:SnoaL-like domain-containing protein n=1 Tax=Kitasatospora terrestris TaxID=258051 RepID=A0ABP9D745_9ACTN